METENSFALNVRLSDGSPAARMKVLVRPENFLSGTPGSEQFLAQNEDYQTDGNGDLVVKSLPSGNYVVEARGTNAKAAMRLAYDAEDTAKVERVLNMQKPGAVSGQVALPVGVKSVTVGVQGLDYLVTTDSLGNFEFESLPAGSFDVIAFVYTDSSFTNKYGIEERVEHMMTFGVSQAEVKSGKEENLYLGDSSWVVPEPEYVDTAKSFVFDDFEDGVDKWFVNSTQYASGELESVSAGAGRKGKAAHFVCENDSMLGWVLMGRYLGDSIDMSGLDSVVFWARAVITDDTTKHTYLSFSFDANVDSTSDRESGKAWVHLDMSSKWTRYVVNPYELAEVDSAHTGGNFGWQSVRKQITDISIFGGVGGEFWIDDIEFFGMKDFTRKPENDE